MAEQKSRLKIIRSPGAVIGLFGLFGPMFGCLGFLALMVWKAPSGRIGPKLITEILPTLLFGGYVVGLLPALATGVIVANATEDRVRLHPVLVGAMSGALCSAFTGLVFGGLLNDRSMFLTLALIGALAGTGCAALTRPFQ
jgi:hypothetical protein